MFDQDGRAKEDFEEVIDRARAALAEVLEFDLERLDLDSRGDAVVAVHGVVDAAVAVRTSVVERMDGLGVWQTDNAISPAAWLRNRAHRPGKEASASVRRGRALRDTPKLAWSFEDGRLAEARVDAVLRVRTPRTMEAFARDENMLVGFAESLRFDKLVQVLQRWLQLADTDGRDPDEKEWAARRFNHSRSFAGTWQSEGFWDRVTGKELDEALRAEAEVLFEEDWAEAKARLGHKPTSADLRRTPSQRRADALADLVRRGAGAGGGEPRPLINIVMGLDMLQGPVAELLDGTILPAGAVARTVLDAHIRRVVFDGPDRVLSISQKSRFFSGLLRDAIEIRDRECRHPICDVPARDCDVDHVVPWPEGETSEENGELLCGHHNRAKGRRAGERRPRDQPGEDDDESD